MKSKMPMTTLKILRRFFCRKSLSKRKYTNSAWERNWRPLFGYSVCLTWVLQMGTLCWVVWINHPKAAEIIMALVETTSLWSMALGVMGISVVKGSLPEQKNAPKKASSIKNHTKINERK